jgi:hypothetical protein
LLAGCMCILVYVSIHSSSIHYLYGLMYFYFLMVYIVIIYFDIQVFWHSVSGSSLSLTSLSFWLSLFEHFFFNFLTREDNLTLDASPFLRSGCYL